MKKPRPQLVIDISDISYYDIGMEDFLAMIKACIFDLDGTIGNTLDSMVYSVNLTLKEMNLSEISKEQCREFVGNGARVLMEKKLAVLSNKPHCQAVKAVHAIYGEKLFDWVQGQKDEIPRKPDPAGVFYVAKKLGVDYKECLYVGDSEVDVVTGKNAGVKTIAVTWGFRTKEELMIAGVQYMIDKAEKLQEYL